MGRRNYAAYCARFAHVLRPGGRFYCVTSGPENDDTGLEFRMRQWLGEAGREFDVCFIERRLFDAVQVATQSAARNRVGLPEVARWKEAFRKSGVRHLAYGVLMIERRSASSCATVRKRKRGRLASAEVEWLRTWEGAGLDPGNLL